MFINNDPIILASGSPRRREYFEMAGLEFSVVCAEVDETPGPVEDAQDYVLRMASEKATGVALENPSHWVVSGDTVVTFAGEILGKPESAEHAVSQLLVLAGKTHEVRTAYCIKHIDLNFELINVVRTEVKFWDFSKEIAMAYVFSGESYDKAGGYGIQGKGSLLVESVQGSYSNVVGFPMYEILTVLLQHNVIAPMSC